MSIFDDLSGFLTGEDFEEESSEQETATSLSQAKKTEQLKLDPLAVQKIIQDVLGGAEGLAEIFAGEQNAGIFNSSVAAQASGDLATKLIGEIAKLTGEKSTDIIEDKRTTGIIAREGSSSGGKDDEGFLGTLSSAFDIFKSLKDFGSDADASSLSSSG